MSDFFSNLPDLVFKKIYKNCDNVSKWNLSTVLKEDGCDQIIKRTGVHNHKETVFCFLCQTQFFWSEFASGDIDLFTNRGTLGFHWRYKKDEAVARGHITTYNLRKNNPEDMEEADLILKYTELRLQDVFKTNNMTELRQHIEIEHLRHNYLPEDFWDDQETETHMALQRAMDSNDFGQQNRTTMEAFFNFMEQIRIQQNLAPQVVTEMLRQLDACHQVGAEWGTKYLQYDGKMQIWTAYPAVQNFRLFCQIIEMSHRNVHQTHFKTLGKLQIYDLKNVLYLYILAENLLHRNPASNRMLVLFSNMIQGRIHHGSMEWPDFSSPL